MTGKPAVLILTASHDRAETFEVHRVPPEDVEAYEMAGWTADHDALKDTNHGRYSVLVWREVG